MYTNKRQCWPLDAKVIYVNTTFDQKWIECFGPNVFYSLDYDIKQKLLYNKIKNIKTIIIAINGYCAIYIEPNWYCILEPRLLIHKCFMLSRVFSIP